MPDPRLDLTRRRFLRLTLGGAAGAALVACGGDAGTPTTGPTGAPTGATPTAGSTAAIASSAPTAAASGLSFDGETVSMAVYARNHASSPLFWQDHAPDGLSVEIQVVTNPSDINRTLEEGSLSFGLMGAFNTILERPQGFTSKIIGMVSRRGIGIVGRADAGIEGMAGLAGRRIGVPPPGAQLLVLNGLLEEVGLDLERDLDPIPLGFADHAAALESGDIDAYAGTEPICATSVSSGLGVYLADPYTTPLGDFNTALWASPAMLERPDLCMAALVMQRGASEHLSPGGENDPEVWRQLLVDEFEYTPEVYEAVLPNIGALWRFDDEQRSQFEGAGGAMLASGAITEEPDYESMYALEFQDMI